MNRKILCLLAVFVALCFFLMTDISLQAQDNKNEDIANVSLEDLLNVKITTAGKKAETIRDIPASVVIVTRADIERMGYQTLDEILENVPGLYGINQRDVTGVMFGVRGFWSATANNMIILINGVRQERMASDGATYMAIQVPPESIDRIEVIRGPMSVIYGTGAFFGVINIITNDVKPENSSLIAVGYGNSRTAKAVARAAFNKDALNFVFNAGLYSTDGPDEPFSKMTTQDLSPYTSKTTTYRRWGDDYKFFNFSGSYKGFYANAAFSHHKKGLDLFFPAATGAIAQRTYSSYSFGYKEDFSPKASIDGKITYHKGDITAQWDWFTPPNEPKLRGDNNYREDYEVDVTAYLNPSPVINFTAGLYYKKIIHEQLLTYVPDVMQYQIGLLEPAQSRALFVQADIAPTNKLKFVLGVRFDQAVEYSSIWKSFADGSQFTGNFDYDKIVVLPRVAAIFKFNEKNILKFFYGKAINHPSIYQTGAQAASGQPALNPEFIETFELNYLAVPSDKLSFNASLFYNNLNKLIVNESYIDSETGTWIGRNVNAGKMKTTGGELTIQLKPVHRLMMEVSGTYQKTKDKRPAFKDITVAYSPEFLGYAKIAYEFSRNIVFSLNGRYVGSMEPYYDITIPGRIADKVNGYFLVGGNLRFSNLFSKGYFLQLSCSNILDENYLYPSFTMNGFWANKGLIGDSRLFMVSIGKKF
ncbi:MAG: TonB-dependent receptor plug domain-containing protein [Candidatus Omnitrophota bacterium]